MEVRPGLVVLRFVNGVVVDHPFAPAVPSPWWAGTLEPDPGDWSGWRRTLWPAAPGGRGWVPEVLHFGDVVEFGSYTDPRWRWFGWFTHRVDEAVVVTGPCPRFNFTDRAIPGADQASIKPRPIQNRTTKADSAARLDQIGGTRRDDRRMDVGLTKWLPRLHQDSLSGCESGRPDLRAVRSQQDANSGTRRRSTDSAAKRQPPDLPNIGHSAD
jgi:hypothetical protein